MADKYANLAALTEFLSKVKAWANAQFATKAVATTSADGLLSSSDKTKLNGIASGATAVSESTVSGWGFTKNAGTITGITMNGASKGTSGTVDLGTVLTSHQDISGKQDKITAITAATTQALYPIKIDSQGHITAYGSAQSIPTKVSQLTNDSGFTTNTGTVTKVSTGAGLTGGDITGSGTVKANLTSETKLTNAAADGTETSGRVYPVRLDKNSKLAVNVPWTDNNTTYTANTTSMYEITGVGSVPSLTFTPNASTGNLTIAWSAGSVPTRQSKTVATGITAS